MWYWGEYYWSMSCLDWMSANHGSNIKNCCLHVNACEKKASSGMMIPRLHDVSMGHCGWNITTGTISQKNCLESIVNRDTWPLVCVFVISRSELSRTKRLRTHLHFGWRFKHLSVLNHEHPQRLPPWAICVHILLYIWTPHTAICLASAYSFLASLRAIAVCRAKIRVRVSHHNKESLCQLHPPVVTNPWYARIALMYPISRVSRRNLVDTCLHVNPLPS